MHNTLYPLLFQPVYQDYLWGGDRIRTTYHRSGTPETTAESWEISDRPEGMSVVSNGPLEGKTLGELVQKDPEGLVGSGFTGRKFPLLVKIIDAAKRLSLQVHPNEAAAQELNAEPKTEMWYVLRADKGAMVYAGLKRRIDPAEFRRAAAEGIVEDMLWPVTVSAGDVVFVPAGRLHAVCKGCLLLEIQQNSNTTYRVHDWGRVGTDGKPRRLHMEEALRSIAWGDIQPSRGIPVDLPSTTECRRRLLQDSRYFFVDKMDVAGDTRIQTDTSSFDALFVVRGKTDILSEAATVPLTAGTSCLVPAALQEFHLQPHSTGVEIVRIRTRQPRTEAAAPNQHRDDHIS